MAHGTLNPPMRDLSKVNESADKAKEAGNQVMDKAKDGLDKARETGNQVMEKAKDAACSVGEMASNAACSVGKSADDLAASAGHNVKQFGDTLGEKAPHEGILGQASQAVAHTLQEGGRYMEDAKFSGMARDVAHVVERHPIPALLFCLGLGVCIGRAMRD